jgi:predicted acyltransferase
MQNPLKGYPMPELYLTQFLLTLIIAAYLVSYQLTVLSSPHPAAPLADAAQVNGILSFTLCQPA